MRDSPTRERGCPGTPCGPFPLARDLFPSLLPGSGAQRGHLGGSATSGGCQGRSDRRPDPSLLRLQGVGQGPAAIGVNLTVLVKDSQHTKVVVGCFFKSSLQKRNISKNNHSFRLHNESLMRTAATS